MPLIYPSIGVSLRIRFDPSMRLIKEDYAKASTTESLVLRPQEVQNSVLSQLVTEVGQDDFSHIVYITPTSANVELPGYRQAGKFSLQFRWSELPIDPRTVKVCGVEIHFGAVTPEDFAEGMTRKDTRWRRKSILDIRDSKDQVRKATVALVGFVDSWSVDFSDNGGNVTIEGRDVRGIFLDSIVGPDLINTLDLNQSILGVITDIISKHPLLGFNNSSDGKNKVKIKYFEEEWPNGLPLVLNDDLAIRTALKARKSKDEKKRKNASAHPKGDQDKTNYWDLITHHCYLVGVIPVFMGEDLYLRRVKNLYDIRVFSNPLGPNRTWLNKPGKPRMVKTAFGEERILIRRLTYGRDIATLKIDRKLGGVKHRPIQVYSVNTSSNVNGPDRMMSVIWPPEADIEAQKKVSDAQKKTSETSSGSSSQEEILVIHLTGIRDKERLTEIARSVYEELNRGELGGSCETNSIYSLGGEQEGQWPDLLMLRPGDAVQFLVDTRALSSRSPLVSAVTEFNRMSFNEAVDEVAKRLGNGPGDKQLAKVVVATARGLVFELTTYFRVSTVRFSWDSSSGVKVSFDFHNYIEVTQQQREFPPVTSAEVLSAIRGALGTITSA